MAAFWNIGSPFSNISFSTPRLISSSLLCRMDIFLSKAEAGERRPLKIATKPYKNTAKHIFSKSLLSWTTFLLADQQSKNKTAFLQLPLSHNFFFLQTIRSCGNIYNVLIACSVTCSCINTLVGCVLRKEEKCFFKLVSWIADNEINVMFFQLSANIDPM